MTIKYAVLAVMAVIIISTITITYAIDPIQNDRKKTGVLFNVQNMNVTTTNGSFLNDFGKDTGTSNGIFFSERYALLNGLKDLPSLGQFGSGIVVGGQTDGQMFEVHTLSNSNTYGLVEFTFVGKCDSNGRIDPDPTNSGMIITSKQPDNYIPQIIDIKPVGTSVFSSICQTP